MRTYILDPHTPVPESDPVVWGMWMEHNSRTVAITDNGVVFVSTAFLGIDHNFMGGSPILFETMVFLNDNFADKISDKKPDLSFDLQVFRWHTWDEAEEGHHTVVSELLREMDKQAGAIGELISNLRVDHRP